MQGLDVSELLAGGKRTWRGLSSEAGDLVMVCREADGDR